MGRRDPRPMPPLTPEQLLAAALRRISELERRIARMEAQSGQQLPGDFRFETGDDGATVVILRVSTGGSTPIAGPL